MQQVSSDHATGQHATCPTDGDCADGVVIVNKYQGVCTQTQEQNWCNLLNCSVLSPACAQYHYDCTTENQNGGVGCVEARMVNDAWCRGDGTLFGLFILLCITLGFDVFMIVVDCIACFLCGY